MASQNKTPTVSSYATNYVGNKPWSETAPWPTGGQIDAGYIPGGGTREAVGAWDSNWALVSGFGFSVPSNAIITGITATYTVAGHGIGDIFQYSAAIGLNNTPQATKGAFASSDGSGTFSSVSAGSASDLWGLSPTPSDINSSNFCVALEASLLTQLQSGHATCNFIVVQVDYTIAAGNSLFFFFGF